MMTLEESIHDIFVQRKFGIFFHWGLYSVLAGQYKGRETPYIGEWIMRRCRIPVDEYSKLASEFNPVDFDADKWVELVERAGAKYLVFTAKHHEGFSLYDTKVCDYNVIKATPFKRDPVAELAEACAKRDIRLCLYYSQDQDWHHPHGSKNDWDYDPADRDFSIYFEEKVIPQVTELLTDYGDIGLIWFDTPTNINPKQSKELCDLVHKLQPGCLVNARIGHGLGDYDQTGDNDLPSCVMSRPWEMPATMNDTWGYKKNDHNWKSSETLIRQLVETVSKGGNYLLNLGPDANGNIPQPSIERIDQIGKWLDVNGYSLFNASRSPLQNSFPWGCITAKDSKLYLQVLEAQTASIGVMGIKNNIKSASILGGNGGPDVNFQQSYNKLNDFNVIELDLSQNRSDGRPFVVELDIDGPLMVDNSIIQHLDGQILLEASLAEIEQNDTENPIEIGEFSSIHNWTAPKGELRWDFKVLTPGQFNVFILTALIREDGDPASPCNWEGGHKVEVTVAFSKVTGQIGDDFRVTGKGSYAEYAGCSVGVVRIDLPGIHSLSIKAESVIADKGLGLTLRAVRLIPVTRPSSRHKIKSIESAKDGSRRSVGPRS